MRETPANFQQDQNPETPPILSPSQQESQSRRARRTEQSMSSSLPAQNKMDKQKLRPEIPPRVSKSSAQRLSRDLTCSICLDLFKQPVSLPCDHTFCEACITSYWSGPRVKCQAGSGSCPQCRKVFHGKSYRPNRIVANIVESYCQGMEESGVRLGAVSEPAPTAPLCMRHREELKLYCEEDQELVCLVCGISQDHRAHTLVCVQDAQKRYRASLTTSANALQKELNTALECERETEEEVKKLKDHTADLKQRIEAQFSELHQFLYQEEKLLQVKLKTEERRELIRLDEHKALLSVEISRLRRAVNDIEDKLSEQDPYTLLRSIKGLLQSRQPPKFERPTLTPPSLCEGRFAGPLQYRVWKSLKGSIYPVPSAITFNSKTANPWLSLTSSLTCVRYQTFNSSVQDNPQRFNAALSLMGGQGFTKGRHYWEVEVYSSTVWTVGVARESVTRKGVINTMPANGFWTLSLSYGVQYMAGTSPPTLLSLEEPLARIGVYLDYKRGLVSFYNAESMTHLYTFRDTFTETLFPYFNLGFLDKVHENEPLKVFMPKI
ncbi:E3 ubiquitin-protein ligase TRIM69 isoform X2 [Danio rerio]|uniref:E3 ubiquitin-protein ligase TRIM69 isoform X2 n=2 Tax=Danio rerio TaxID=7955 RepID=A0AC58GIP9_DANRE|nr:tripartite motif containing 69 isoform X1 [Danio rerio]|eukprot:XP_009303917.1 tripartite motif containing 69 isoform X1 [Danio rerio]